MTARLAGTAAIASLLLSACGSRADVVPSHALAAHSVKVTFTMRWPGSGSSTHRRRPRFISPSAQSLVVEVNSASTPAGPVTFANNPSINGAPATTTLAIDAPPGRDDFAFAVFDQPQTPGETVPVGNQIGRAEVTQTIVPGAANTVNAVIAGIVGGVRIAPAANQPFVETLSAAAPQAYALVGDQAETFVLTALDVDGNVIVPVDTSPAHVDTPLLGLRASPASNELTVAPVATDPSRFTVTATAPKNSPGSALAVIASASDSYGDRAQSNVAIDERSAVYVTYGAGAAASVAVYDDYGNLMTLPAGAFSGLSAPGAIAYDADDHRVFIADGARIAAFDASGNLVSGYTAPAVNAANGIAYDANDKLVYVSAPGVVNIFTPSGGPPPAGPASFAAPNAAGIAYLAGLTPQIVVADANSTAPSFDVYGEDGTPAGSFPIGGASVPTAIAYAASSNAIYVSAGSTIASFAPTGAPAATRADPNAPAALACDPNLADLYVAEVSTGALPAYALDLSGIDAAHGIAALSPGSTPKGVAVAF